MPSMSNSCVSNISCSYGWGFDFDLDVFDDFDDFELFDFFDFFDFELFDFDDLDVESDFEPLILPIARL